MSGLDRLFVPDLAWSGKPWRHYITADRQTCRRSLTAAAATAGLTMEALKEVEERRGVWSGGGEVKGHRVCILYGMKNRMKDTWRTQRWNDAFICMFLPSLLFTYYNNKTLILDCVFISSGNILVSPPVGMKMMSVVNKGEVCVIELIEDCSVSCCFPAWLVFTIFFSLIDFSQCVTRQHSVLCVTLQWGAADSLGPLVTPPFKTALGMSRKLKQWFYGKL